MLRVEPASPARPISQERWRRERLPGAGPSHKKRPVGGLGATIETASAILAPGEKRHRKRPTFFRHDFVDPNAAATQQRFGGAGAPGGRYGGGGGVGAGVYAAGACGGGAAAAGDDSDDGGAFRFGSSLERMRARAERRRLFGAPPGMVCMRCHIL